MKILCQNKPFSVIYDIDRFCYSPVGYYAQTLLTQPALALSPFKLNCPVEVALRAQTPLTSPSNEDKTQKLCTSAWRLRTLSFCCDRLNTNPLCSSQALCSRWASKEVAMDTRGSYTHCHNCHIPASLLSPSMLCWQECPALRHHSIVSDPSTSSTPTQDAAGGSEGTKIYFWWHLQPLK